MVSSEEAFSKGIIKGLKPYATKENKKAIESVTTAKEYNKLYSKEDKKEKKKKDKFLESMKKKLSNKPVLRKQPQATVTIPQAPTEGVLNDTNRFFKSSYEKEKRSMFFE